MRGRDRESRQTSLDWAVEALMAAMLVFLPLAYGTTQPWSQEIYFVFVAAIGLCTLLRAIVYGDRLVWTWAYGPIVLFIALVVLQRVPLPNGALAVISPNTLALRTEVLSGLVTAEKTPVTFYSLATERQLRLVLSVATIFASVVQYYRTPERRNRLLMSIAGAGTAVALFAAYQDLSRADMIYGVVPVGHKNAGPFQNYSHFSQFMNLSIGAALAWLLASLAAWSNGWRDAGAAREQIQMAEHAFFWPAVGLLLGGPLLVFASMSRMGMISMLAAGAITAGLLGWRGKPTSGRRRRTKAPARRRGASLFYVATFAVAAVALLSIVGFDWVFDRLATVQSHRVATIGTRQNLIRDLIPLWKQFPLLGTGLGTHEFVFPWFNRQPSINLFTHAENEYAQLMEETGAIGVVLALAFLAMIAFSFVRAIRSPQRPEQYAAFGLGFGLLAILIHSGSDFGQHVPAVATLTAISAALVIRISWAAVSDGPGQTIDESTSSRHSPSGQLPWAKRWGSTASTATAVAVFGWVVLAADTDRRAAAYFDDAQEAAAEVLVAPSDEEYARVVSAAAKAQETQPADIAYAHWAGVARWQKLAHDVTDPQTGQLRFMPDRVDEVRRLIADLEAARLLCPTFGPPLGLAAQLRARVLGDAAGDALILKAYRLTPHDRELARLAGLLAVREKRWDDAMPILDRYVRLGGPRWQVVDAFAAANRPDLAQAAAAGDRVNLKRLADGLAAGWPAEQARAAACLAESERLLLAESDAPDASAQLLAERAYYERQHGRPDQAIEWFQRALDADYDQADWRMARAMTLFDAGRTGEAEQDLRIVLRQRPDWTEAKTLLGRAATTRPTPSNRP